ncbi:acc synthase [Aspergillus flavus]|uniref:Acc synthase n=1 Tax=Aspergillus flavus (strain ATCC 200026 / FGSC A1120 / IAM 13836 / NRRL 3357 / JCM 12722 / SRRC 167) TaxID=332952 RepID=A0A7U2R202_ASPFN|nr:acc synthase [Aspergillus flavus]
MSSTSLKLEPDTGVPQLSLISLPLAELHLLYSSNNLINHNGMLSKRGETYAEAGLANGYLGHLKAPFDKENKEGVVCFSNAENFLMQDVILHYIRTRAASGLDRTRLTYREGPFGSRRLREAMAKLITTYFYPASPITSDNILFTSGVTNLNAVCAPCLTDPKDGILLDLSVPSGCQLIYTSFQGDDPFGPSAVIRYEEAFLKARDEDGVSVRALLICNPHNPLGRCYPRETLEALLQFCQKYQIHIISDEVYALSVYEENTYTDGFISLLSIEPANIGVNPALIHVLYGMSKDFAAAGLRLGCLISQNQKLLQAALSISRFHWPSNISCSIATIILEDQSFIKTFGIFLWVDLSRCLNPTLIADQGGWAAELDLSSRLLQIGVRMSSGYAYHNEVPGWFRITFSVEMETLEEGLSRYVPLYGVLVNE